MKLTIKGVEHFVFPSTELLKPKESGGFLPDDAKTPAQIIAFISTWAKEYALLEGLLHKPCPLTHLNTSLIRYIQLVKKGNKYEKVTDENNVQQWDLTTLLDMMFSFWMLLVERVEAEPIA